VWRWRGAEKNSIREEKASIAPDAMRANITAFHQIYHRVNGAAWLRLSAVLRQEAPCLNSPK